MLPKNNEDVIYQWVVKGLFRIDEMGRVWRGTRRAENNQGHYLMVRKMSNGIRTHALAHRLVFRHFHGQIPAGMVINHKNGNKKDNRPCNLELTTYSGNVNHALRVLKVNQRVLNQSGENNLRCKLTNDQVVSIREIYAKGGITQKEIAELHNVTYQTVSEIVRGRSRRTAAGPTGDYTARRQGHQVRNNKGQFI